FRFVECGRLRDGVPDGQITPWDEVRFPFRRELRDRGDLAAVPVERLEGEGPLVEERYRCTAAGTFEITLTCLEDGWSCRYDLGRRGEGPAIAG
ncbi:MAG TPA: Hsp70 family protein, partial [Thermoanaerobaculia bacterium]|nr:Hsp70 family protein [Thermoanaerobaculia bacterium]